MHSILSICFLLLSSSFAQSSDTDPYVPQRVACPADLKIRSAQNLSSQEQAWRSTRLTNVVQSLEAYLSTANISDFNQTAYLSKINATNAPIVGLAVSGGGTQSGIGGLGIWQAFDGRYAPAIAAGTGGIAQCLSYLTGLSGGGAVTVSTLASNNYSTVDQIRNAINFSTNYVVGPTGNVTEYYTGIFENTGAKDEAGFPVSVTDSFGQFWAQYLPESWAYKDFSDLANASTSFAKGSGPMPIIGLAEVIPGQSPNFGNIMAPGRTAKNGFKLTSYEITPFEFGSWLGGRVQAFMPTKWLGSAMAKGVPQGKTCVRGFDKFSFIQGSTTNAFNFWLIDSFFGIPLFAKRFARRQSGPAIHIPPSQANNPEVQLVNETATYFQQTFNQSLWATYPNPFQGYNKAMKGVSELLLVDGSETGETIPLRSLIVPQRAVDFIIAYEASSDALNSWVNGTNLVNTAQSASQGGIPFPKIPSVKTIVNRRFNINPTFFGCNDTTDAPLVLYLPNSPWSAYTNYSFTKPSFTDTQMNVTLENAFNVATYGNGTVDKAWPQCLACAVIKKSVERVQMTLPQVCENCWSQHCWDGKENNTKVNPQAFNLKPLLNPGLSYVKWNRTIWNA